VSARFSIVVGSLVALCASASAAPDHIAYIARAVAALRAMTPPARAAFDRELYEAARTTCHADASAPTNTCLVEVARKRCGADASCAAAADVVITNQLSVPDFIDDAARIRIVRGSTDFQAALAAKLRERYGVLATELVLSGSAIGDAGDGAAIDRLCRERDRSVHACEPGDATCVGSLPWSRCVAALAWYVAGAAGGTR
jgi:hypothetical protein